MRVRVRPHVKIVFVLADHNDTIQISTFEHGIELDGAVFTRLHAFHPLHLLDALSVAQDLLLHLLVQELLHLHRESARYLEFEIRPVPLVTAGQNVFVEL
jgi:hypothetical protein